MTLTAADGIALTADRTQDALAVSARRLSSGLRISSAADDPSGLAIATNLGTQAQGLDQGQRNVGDASNAIAVAEGALTTVTALLQRMRSLTVAGRNDLVSPSGREAINAEMTSISREIDTVAQAATFNGQPLFAAPTAPKPAGQVATVGRDDTMANGQQFVDPASLYVNTGTGTDFTLTGKVLSYDPVSGNVTVQFNATSDDGQSFLNAPFPHNHVYAANSGSAIWWINDASGATRLITFTTPSIAPSDVSKQFSVSSSHTAPTAPTGALSVATGEREGQAVALSTNPLSAATLGVSDPALTTSDAANQSLQAAVDAALATVGGMRAQTGAQEVSLGEESSNAATTAANLAASRSAITDLNVGSESTAYAKTEILANIQYALASSTRQEAFTEIGILISRLA